MLVAIRILIPIIKCLYFEFVFMFITEEIHEVNIW